MAVESNIEWKLEGAWITALGLNTDLAGVTIRRGTDASSNITYPCVVVFCSGSMQPPEWAGTVGYDTAFIEISAMTYRKNDLTGELVARYIGAVRDSVRNVNLRRDLNLEDGLTIHGYEVEGFSSHTDDNRVRRMTMTVKCHASASNIPDDVSSASTSSSGSSASSSSVNSTTSLSSSSSPSTSASATSVSSTSPSSTSVSSSSSESTSSQSTTSESSQSASSSSTAAELTSASSTSESSANSSSSTPSSSISSTSESSG